MATTLAPLPVQAFRDNNGAPLAGGKLFTYQAGTTTPVATYTDSSGTTNANPVLLNARGECNLWLLPNVAYKFLLQDSLGNTIWTVDQIVNSQLVTLYGGVDTGAVNAYAINFTANFASLSNGILIYFVPSHTNTGASTLNVNSLGVINILNQDGSALTAGQIVASGITGVIYFNGNWYLISATGSVPKAGTFQGQPTGFTAIAAVTVNYIINGSQVTLTIPYFNATSNATTLTMTGLPAALQPAVNRAIYPIALGMDNGVTINNILAQIDPASGTITFWKSASAGSNGWTNSGGKGLGVLLGGILPYGNSLTYSLT